MSSASILVACAAFAVSFIATGMLRRHAIRRNLLDVPNSRSSHKTPTPRGGGAAIVAAFYFATCLLVVLQVLDVRLVAALWFGSGLMALIGFIDDRKPQSAIRRIGVHLTASATAVIGVSGLATPWMTGFGLFEAWLWRGIAVFALVWVSNLFNFMDGIDGIAGSEAIFVMSAAAWLNANFGGDVGLTTAMLCVATASVGFILWNWPPARIFMGDVGSGFLGYVIGFFALYTSLNGALHLIAWVILGAVFLTDATVTLLRRVIRGDRWTEAHRMHAYQHCARRLKGHRPVTTAVAAINVFWLLPLAYLSMSTPRFAPLWLIVAIGPLIVLALALGAGRED